MLAKRMIERIWSERLSEWVVSHIDRHGIWSGCPQEENDQETPIHMILDSIINKMLKIASKARSAGHTRYRSLLLQEILQ